MWLRLRPTGSMTSLLARLSLRLAVTATSYFICPRVWSDRGKGRRPPARSQPVRLARLRRREEKTIASAISARVRGPAPTGRPSRSPAAPTGRRNVPTAPSVRVGPGATVLTRIPAAPNAAAQDRVKDSSAALAAAGDRREGGRRPTRPIEEMLTMATRSPGDHLWQQRRGQEKERRRARRRRTLCRNDSTSLLQCRSRR